MRFPRFYALFCLCVLLAFCTSKVLGLSVLGSVIASSAAGSSQSPSGSGRVSHK